MQAPDRVVLSDLWWLATAAAPAYQDKQILFVGNSRQSIPHLMQAITQAGIQTFSWIGLGSNLITQAMREEGYVPMQGPPMRTVYNLQALRFERSEIPESH